MPDKKKTWAERLQKIMGTATAPMRHVGGKLQRGEPILPPTTSPLDNPARVHMRHAANQVAPTPERPTGRRPGFELRAPRQQGPSVPDRMAGFNEITGMAQTPPAASPMRQAQVSEHENRRLADRAQRNAPPPAAPATPLRTPTAPPAGPAPATGAPATTAQGGTGNRYLDIARAGAGAQNQAFDAANIIETIRGTPGTARGNFDPKAPSHTFGYFNPNNPRAGEFQTAIGAATGMDKPTAMGLYGVDAPVQGQLDQERIRQAGGIEQARMAVEAAKASAKGHPPKMTALEGRPGDPQQLAVMDAGGNVSFIDPANPPPDPAQLSYAQDIVNRASSGSMSREEFDAEWDRMPESLKAYIKQLVAQTQGGGR